jgi:hypothetical protein
LGYHNTGVTVLFDDEKRPTCLHRDYISAVKSSGHRLAPRPQTPGLRDHFPETTARQQLRSQRP